MADGAKPGFNGIRDTSFAWTRRPAAQLDLAQKKVAVVGGTNGIGRALSRLMAARGAHVTEVGRSFRDADVAGIDFLPADLSSMAEAADVGRTLSAAALDVVVMTTGIMAAPKREATAEGIERDLAVSYLSRLAVLRELAPALVRDRSPDAPRPRVFVMGFPGTGQAGNVEDLNAERGYDSMAVHMNTVAGNEALVLDCARRHPGVGFFGLNPGLIKTNIRANVLGGEGSIKQRLVESLIGLAMPSAETYAERVVPLLFAPELEGRSGLMFNRKGDAILPSAVMTEAHVAALLSASEALLARTRPAAA
jgi:NAD(P)-dependent dehydrogenase (short-subunit alcohol dehydrogenase family)